MESLNYLPKNLACNTHNFDLKMHVWERLLYTSNKFFGKLPEFNHSMYGANGRKQTLPMTCK